MNASDILIWLRAKGISLYVVNGELRAKGPDGRLTPNILKRIRARREELTEALSNSTYALYRRKVKRWPEDMKAAFWRVVEEARTKGTALDAFMQGEYESGERMIKAMKADGTWEKTYGRK